MGAFSIWHILVVLVVILLVFGAGKLPRVMGDFAKGIKSFKQGLKEGAEPAASPAPPTEPVERSPNSIEAQHIFPDTTKSAPEKV